MREFKINLDITCAKKGNIDVYTHMLHYHGSCTKKSEYVIRFYNSISSNLKEIIPKYYLFQLNCDTDIDFIRLSIFLNFKTSGLFKMLSNIKTEVSLVDSNKNEIGNKIVIYRNCSFYIGKLFKERSNYEIEAEAKRISTELLSQAKIEIEKEMYDEE